MWRLHIFNGAKTAKDEDPYAILPRHLPVWNGSAKEKVGGSRSPVFAPVLAPGLDPQRWVDNQEMQV